ncbi:ATP-binding protein [Microbacterium sp. SSM24]|uniref:ATP-binding protein n=1 Tax=Microbacterium sp. SSM24 TaxID=2991714 RepID=UPI0022279A98|nr:ATP-binding protein [Microbacterium sp. SSM24]MCW3494225.1 AAA family ATPase [Microbacterium sp. SSM24]
MNAITVWAAELLAAAWQRQEHEGRYRGSDDFRALHIDPADAAASWRAAMADDAPWPPHLGDSFARLEVPDGLGLAPAERLVAALACAVESEPRLRPLVASLTDDPLLRQPTVALALELAGAVGAGAHDVHAALAAGSRLLVLGLVRVEPIAGRPSPLDGQIVADEWLVRALDGLSPDAPSGTYRVVRAPATPDDATPHLDRPVLLTGADHVRHAESWRRPCIVGPARNERDLAMLLRAGRLRHDAVVVAVDAAPEPWLVAGLDAAAALGWAVGLSLPAGITWVAPARWRHLEVRAPGVDDRAARWRISLGDRGVVVEDRDVAVVAHEYRLGLDAIDEAAERVAVQIGEGAAGLGALRVAARRTSWRDLSSCARPGPVGNTWDDLVVTDDVRGQLVDAAAAIGQRGRVLDEWGFGSRPGSRGYHILFAGPSGTGKTMSAGVVAEAAGLELWVVDLARVVDKYLGETEKAIDRVLRAAESSGAMLLFDEADALFGRRGDVREAKDRWANVEVAFLLQRIEEHDGVTVLTTNVSHHLDEAFARRMSQRVEFTVPDARLRLTLWHRSIPGAAPLADDSDLDRVAEHFELAGGAIRTAALNAAYAAAADEGPIRLPHLVRASVRELSKAGRTPTRSDLGDLGVHLQEAR